MCDVEQFAGDMFDKKLLFAPCSAAPTHSLLKLNDQFLTSKVPDYFHHQGIHYLSGGGGGECRNYTHATFMVA